MGRNTKGRSSHNDHVSEITQHMQKHDSFTCYDKSDKRIISLTYYIEL